MANKPVVKCSVANCAYWGEGNNCNADAIMIDIDEHAGAKYKAEFAGETFDTEHQDYASKSSETCCHTFKPKAGASK
ncbi:MULTISPECIES: DUF1540 domain-containing protein [unclassified Paenibacillus]|uniref:DUF1540 domain-containing protein n=1 Tax=unclassified Paenibacillus TaxID=185978 RepID=UPI001C0FCEF7|nr:MULTISPECIES: DUF1540 domain-containing protein [unclassified Paenibacillus]MBU5440480.1 DUF1540 domain-containing protein [Paenibacillus sp. MSJ-34]CAH0119597.1 hypothetical protein PAE9249_02101 [Paenibacillus sp. CECT 9249]